MPIGSSLFSDGAEIGMEANLAHDISNACLKKVLAACLQVRSHVQREACREGSVRGSGYMGCANSQKGASCYTRRIWLMV